LPNPRRAGAAPLDQYANKPIGKMQDNHQNGYCQQAGLANGLGKLLGLPQEKRG